MSGFNCCFLTCIRVSQEAAAYRFLRRQVRWSGIPISLRPFQFVVIHTVQGFGVVNEAEVDALLGRPCALKRNSGQKL